MAGLDPLGLVGIPLEGGARAERALSESSWSSVYRAVHGGKPCVLRAFPGIDAEERGQSEAIGHNLFVMAGLKVPLIATIIGEGGSGGALAIAMGDAVIMLQFATYAVISPEGCASILWKTAEKAPEAAEALGLTAHRLKALGLIDKIVNEPLGGAHRDPKAMATMLKRALAESLRQFQGMKTSELQARRHERLMAYGKFKETDGR